MSAAKTFLKDRRRHAGRLVEATAALSLAGGALLILQVFLIAGVADGVLFQTAAIGDLWPAIAAIGLVAAARAGLALAARQTGFAIAARVEDAARRELADHLLRLGPVRLAGIPTGAIATSLVEGIDALESYYSRYLPAIATTALIPTAILAVVLPLDWLSALVMAVTAPLIPFFMVLIGGSAEKLNQRQWLHLTRMSARFLDTIEGLTTLKLFNASRREAETVSRMADDYRAATMKVLRVAFLSALALEFFATVSIAVIAVFIGFRLLAGDMEFQRGLFILLLAPEFYLPLRTLGLHYHARMEAIGAVDGIADLLAIEPAPRPAGGTFPAPTRPPAIAFRNVDLVYPDGRRGLAGASLSIAAGESVALVGPSGAGKSSIANLLLRFVEPSAGEITIDGVSLSDIDPESWRRAVAHVPQHPYLFAGSIIDNLQLGSPRAEREAVAAAIRAVGAEAFVSSLPQGLDTMIGECGIGLSGGQARRIALARALVRQAPLIILDEPSGSLDADAEAFVSDIIRRLKTSHTVIVIAHRPASIEAVDRVIRLAAGRVAAPEEGR